MLIANLCFFSADGHNHYRVHAPSRALAKFEGVTAIDCDMYHRAAAWLAAEADVIVLHGLNPEWQPIIQRRRSRGQVTLFEASDHYLDIHAWSTYSVGWLDRSLQDLFRQTLAAVDAVQTSTEALAKIWSVNARRVFVFPNPIDSIPPLVPIPNRPLTVGWAGSGTHLADWAAVAPAVERWIAARPNTRLAIMTDARAQELVQLPEAQYAFRTSGTLTAYREFLRGLDIGFVPLLPGPFNNGRTDLKFLDYAACGLPGIYPRIGPYAAAVVDGETGLLYDSPEELVRCLERLAASVDLRSKIRTGAHAAAMDRHSKHDPGYRLTAYRELLGHPGRSPELPAEVRSPAVVDGRYLRLEPAAPEKVLAAAIQNSATESSATDLMNLLREFPGHFPAARQLARTFNDLGRSAEARGVSERVVAAMPDSPGAQIEMARALLGLGQPELATHHLERAVVANPRHPVAWELLQQTAPDRDAARRNANLWVRNTPSQYMPALAALTTLDAADAISALRELLARFTPGLHPEERPYAAAAFAQAASALAGAVNPETLEPPLHELADAFPESAHLADLHGECLYRLGRTIESDAAFARAAQLNRIAIAVQLDAEVCTSRVWRWQVAEYAVQSRSASPHEPPP